MNFRSLSDNFWNTYETVKLDDAEKRGRAIWFQATMGNARYHTKVLPQAVSILMDWGKVLDTDKRFSRFKTWGLINDPDCIQGNSDSFGFDYCPGDDKLLDALYRKQNYVDPAFDLEKRAGMTGKIDSTFTREDASRLAFGTSAGVVGFRKLPNPKFDVAKWQSYNGSKRYSKFTSERLADGSIEPPFLVGIACASCHTGLHPLNPPLDPERPTWDNISGYVGGQHLRFSEMMASGMDINSLPYQSFIHARAGTTDTSQVPTDFVFNPGSINPIFNFDIRLKNVVPRTITRDRRVNGQWVHSTQVEATLSALKGGEDDVGEDLALQRVFVNIGMCSEECWINHLVDFKALAGRNITQTPLQIQQCRRDCPAWRAIEDRIGDLEAFLNSRRSMELASAGEFVRNADGTVAYDPAGKPVYDKNFGAEKVRELTVDKKKIELGRFVFSQRCAVCHSNQTPSRASDPADRQFFKNVDFTVKKDGVRQDWLGNDLPTAATTVGSNICRALHSNHMKGHIWDEFSSDDYKNEAVRETVVLGNIRSKGEGGGRGYYRNVSLLSLWMGLQMFHNKGLGKELCSYTPQAYDALAKKGKTVVDESDCVSPYRAYTTGDRLKLIDEALDQLLLITDRKNKTTVTDADIEIKLGSAVWPKYFGLGKEVLDNLNLEIINKTLRDEIVTATIKIPEGIPVVLLGSLNQTQFLKAQLASISKNGNIKERYVALAKQFAQLTSDKDNLIAELRKYAFCSDEDNFEDQGHERFVPTELDEKQALKAYLKTL